MKGKKEITLLVERQVFNKDRLIYNVIKYESQNLMLYERIIILKCKTI